MLICGVYLGFFVNSIPGYPTHFDIFALLKGIDKAKGTKLDNKYKWQKLSKEKYYELLVTLRDMLKEDEEFWRIERYWKLG